MRCIGATFPSGSTSNVVERKHILLFRWSGINSSCLSSSFYFAIFHISDEMNNYYGLKKCYMLSTTIITYILYMIHWTEKITEIPFLELWNKILLTVSILLLIQNNNYQYIDLHSLWNLTRKIWLKFIYFVAAIQLYIQSMCSVWKKNKENKQRDNKATLALMVYKYRTLPLFFNV